MGEDRGDILVIALYGAMIGAIFPIYVMWLVINYVISDKLLAYADKIRGK